MVYVIEVCRQLSNRTRMDFYPGPGHVEFHDKINLGNWCIYLVLLQRNILENFGEPCGKVFDKFVLYQPISHSYPLFLSYRIEVNEVKAIRLEVELLFMRIC
jgi:hypothetical protein